MNAERRRQGTGTLFSHAVALTGMSLAEAAAFLGVSDGTARAYSLGTRDAPPKILDRLANLWSDMTLRADPGLLPPAALERRQAIQEIRARAWSVKAHVTTRDLERAGRLRDAVMLERSLRRPTDGNEGGGKDGGEDGHD